MTSEIARQLVDFMQNQRKTTETVELFTDRESELLDFLAKGYLYKEIAAEIFIINHTVKKHIYNNYGKLHAQTLTQALNRANN